MLLLPICVAMIISPTAVTSNANLRTLRVFNMQVCDEEELKIECWPNTIISISEATYAQPVTGEVQCLSQPHAFDDKSRCVAQDVREHIQASCKDRQECTLAVSNKLFENDSCSNVQRYLDVSYKCRPNKFFTRVACEKEKLRLRCHKSLRIIIYNASFGSSKSGAVECPEESKIYEDCQASFATETAMNSCHGFRKCTLSADSSKFGKPGCSENARVFLKVVYTCVPKASLQDVEFEEENDSIDYPSIFKPPETSEILHSAGSININRFTTPSNYHKAVLADLNITTTKKVDVQSDETSDDATDVNCTAVDDNQKVIGFITEWIAAYKFIKENKEKFILYVTISVGAGILLFLIVLTVRLYTQQRQTLKQAELNISEPIPLTLDEDCSELEHYDPRHDRTVEVVRYTNTSTIRRQDSTSQPRAPLSHSMNNYYYS